MLLLTTGQTRIDRVRAELAAEFIYYGYVGGSIYTADDRALVKEISDYWHLDYSYVSEKYNIVNRIRDQRRTFNTQLEYFSSVEASESEAAKIILTQAMFNKSSTKIVMPYGYRDRYDVVKENILNMEWYMETVRNGPLKRLKNWGHGIGWVMREAVYAPMRKATKWGLDALKYIGKALGYIDDIADWIADVFID